jgi:hypothetical protein
VNPHRSTARITIGHPDRIVSTRWLVPGSSRETLVHSRMSMSGRPPGFPDIMFSPVLLPAMERPTRVEGYRFVGDKRTQRVYDLDAIDHGSAAEEHVNDLMATGQYLVFGPDTLAEARNRGYRLARV